MNVKLLRMIQKHILEEPKRFMMSDVVEYGDPGDSVEDFGLWWRLPSCGTAACIAGWACILTKQHDVDMYLAEKVLDITSHSSTRLFLTSSWPSRYIKAWRKANSPAGRARVAVRRIDQFIKTKGAE